ncbi:MAG: 4Fe-4S binding protein [Actinomycetota bacterium]
MTYVIAEACVGVKDQSCVEVCPVDCIHTEHADEICYIDPDACIDCDACLVACPVGAIYAEADVPAASAPWTAINADWFRDKAATRARVAALID